MKLLITGAGGQLGTALLTQAQAQGFTACGLTHRDLDITRANDVDQAIQTLHPDIVINAAAWTDVDRAETEPEATFAVNRDGAAHVARACTRRHIPLIHLSTDYVFDGDRSAPWTEDDLPHPVNTYGASKLAGEEAVRNLCPHHLILRTSWIFSSTGNNFVRTMLRLGREKEELSVVSDQFGKPTSSMELAHIILQIILYADQRWGTYHVAQPDAISWHGFAKAIFDEAKRQGIPLRVQRISPIPSDAWPTPARRPLNSVLDCHKLESTFHIRIQPWLSSLRTVIHAIRQQQPDIHSQFTR